MLLAMLDQFVGMLLRYGLLPPDVAVDTGNLEQEANDLFLKLQMTDALLLEQAGNTHRNEDPVHIIRDDWSGGG
jgi:hypothetical protein